MEKLARKNFTGGNERRERKRTNEKRNTSHMAIEIYWNRLGSFVVSWIKACGLPPFLNRTNSRKIALKNLSSETLKMLSSRFPFNRIS